MMLIGFLVFLIGASALLGLPPAYDPVLSYAFLAAMLFSVALYFLATRFVRSWIAARRVGYFLTFVGAGVGLYFLTQFAYGTNIDGTPALMIRIGKLTTILPDLGLYKLHPNSAATFVEGIIPLAVLLAITVRNIGLKVILALCTGVMLLAILVGFSRGAMAALAVGLLLAILLMLRRRPVPLAVFAILLGIAVLAAVQLGVTDKALGWAGDRLDLYRNSVAVAKDYFFTGIGIGGTFSLIYSRFGLLLQVPYLQHPHNLILMIWMGNGLLGLVALLGLYIAYPLYVLQIMRRARPQPLFYAIVIGVVIVAVHSLVDLVMPVVFILMGMTISLGHLALEEAETERAGSPAPRRPYGLITALGVALLVAAGAVVFFQQPLRAAWETNLGAVDETRASLSRDLSDDTRERLVDSAQAHYEAALAIDPLQPSANRRLGNLDLNLAKYKSAVPLLETALAEDANHPAGRKGLGLAYTWVGRIDDAVRIFQQLEDPPAMRNELYTWGYYLNDKGQPLQAAYSWDTAATMGGGANLDLQLLIADTYRRAEAAEQARRWYQKALESDPENQQASQALQALDASS